ncbi:MAG TPA: hypothetical protein VFR10_01020 [bacterium]|nr:hypothetical protein [bacterium]
MKLGQSGSDWTPAWIGAGTGAIAGLDVLLGNQHSCSPQEAPASCALIMALFVGAGFLLGAAFGAWGGVLSRRLRIAEPDGADALGFLVPALVFFSQWAALAVLPFLFLRAARRKFLPWRSRLDSFFVIFLWGAAVALLPAHSPQWEGGGRRHAGVPMPGSIPVTVTVHPGPGFTESAAVHPPIQHLNAGLDAKRQALWTGRIPILRGSAGRWRLPGGGIITWVPPHRWSRRLLSLVARPISADPRANPAGLAELAHAAGIPILRTPPDLGDPPLALRILEMDAPVTPEDAQRFRASGAWIDVLLADEEKIAFSGEGIRVGPDSTSASLLDVLPTALHLLGLAIPRSTDGRVLTEILDPLGQGARTPRYGFTWSSASITSK